MNKREIMHVNVERMERQLRCLRNMGMVFESTMGIEEVLSRTVQQITQLMEAERSTLFIREDDGVFVSYVLEGEELSEIRLSQGQGIAGWVARAGHPLNIPDVRSEDRFDPSWDEKFGYSTRCVLCQPIRSSQTAEVIGVVEVINKRGGIPFDDADLELLGLLSGRVALIIENFRLMVDLIEKNKSLAQAKNELERHNRELGLLLDLEKRVAVSEDIGGLFISILKRVIAIVGADIGLLYLPDENGAEMRVVSQGEEGYRVFRVGMGTGFAGWVTAKGKELILDSPTEDPRFTARLSERIGVIPRNIAAVPLFARDSNRAHGSILVANKRLGGSFGEHDLALLRLVASRLSEAIEDLSGRDMREKQQRLAAIGRALAGVLHDLKTPMSIISGYAELLEASSKSEESKDYLERIKTALDRMTNMSKEIIAFSKGERSLLIGSVLIDDLVKDFLKSIEALLDANSIELVTHVRLSGSVKLDRDKIIRAFQNIVQNSVDAMKKGGTLTFEVDQLGNELVFGFTDTGIGIDEKIQGTLFQSFVTLGKEHGTGLGLAVAREIIESHKGTITYTTTTGKGTTFLISIPAT